jgi:hypothetical protein
MSTWMTSPGPHARGQRARRQIEPLLGHGGGETKPPPTDADGPSKAAPSAAPPPMWLEGQKLRLRDTPPLETRTGGKPSCAP